MRRPLSAAVVLFGVALAAPARAEDAMQKVFDRARSLHRDGKFAEAKAAYREVLAKGGAAHAVAVCNLGGVERDLKEWVDSATHLAACLRLPSLDKERGVVIEKALEAVRKEVLTVRVDGVPAGASLLVLTTQGSAELATAREFFVAAGIETEVELVVGEKRRKSKVRGEKGATVALTWEVERKPVEGPAPGPGPAPEAPSKPVGWKTPVGVSFAVLGAIGMGVGGGLIGVSDAKDKQGDKLRDELVVNGLCPAVDQAKCAELLVVRRDQDNFFNAGVPVFVAGAVLATAGVVIAAVPVGARTNNAAFWLRVDVGRLGLIARF